MGQLTAVSPFCILRGFRSGWEISMGSELKYSCRIPPSARGSWCFFISSKGGFAFQDSCAVDSTADTSSFMYVQTGAESTTRIFVVNLHCFLYENGRARSAQSASWGAAPFFIFRRGSPAWAHLFFGSNFKMQYALFCPFHQAFQNIFKATRFYDRSGSWIAASTTQSHLPQ